MCSDIYLSNNHVVKTQKRKKWIRKLSQKDTMKERGEWKVKWRLIMSVSRQSFLSVFSYAG